MSSSRTSTPFIVNVGVSAFSSHLASSRVAVDPSFVLHLWYYKRARLKLKIHCTKLPEGEESNRDELRSINTLKNYFQESIANQRRPRFDSPFYTLKESKTDISLLSPSAFRNIKISASTQIYFLKNLYDRMHSLWVRKISLQQYISANWMDFWASFKTQNEASVRVEKR